MGQRVGKKREPILSQVNYGKDSSPDKIRIGDVIDDGTDHPMSLASNFPESVAKEMLRHLQEQYSKKEWKFWII